MPLCKIISLYTTTIPEEAMRILCLFGHTWEHCTCLRCEKNRGAQHNWQGLRCQTCGHTRQVKQNGNRSDFGDENEYRAYQLAKKYNFDFSQQYHDEIRSLLLYEFDNYPGGSSEYLRFLCGYLYCIGHTKDLYLIKKVKYGLNMDVGCMVDGEWIESIEEDSYIDEFTRSREEIVQSFVDYYISYFS